MTRANAALDLPTMVIAVMGVTGAGKSTFIKTASGREDVNVGHGLQSCTAKVHAYQFHTEKYNIVLIDTPGFNDTVKSDTEVLHELAKWLEITYRENSRLTGIIYLHSILDVRMTGSAMKNLKMFRKLCGDDPLSNVVIASTFWGTSTPEINAAHEKELCETPEFWGDMIKHGALVSRFDGSQASAIEILMEFAKKDAITLDIQRELVDKEIPLRSTGAGTIINAELAEQEKIHRQELARLKKEVDDALAEKDIKLEETLRKEREKVGARLDRIHEDQAKWRQQRGEEIRKITMEHEARYRQMQLENDKKIQQVQADGEQRLAESTASFREEMARLENLNSTVHRKGGKDIGGKLVQVITAGVVAVATEDPLKIPLVIAGLVDLVNEFNRD